MSGKHSAEVVKESVSLHPATSGIVFTVRCCGTHERSVHIQNPGKHSQEELRRLMEDHKARVEAEHESHLVAHEFLKSLADPGEAAASTLAPAEAEDYKGCCE